MNRVAIALLFVLAAVFAARAEGVTVKGTTVPFRPPAGFVNLDTTDYKHIADEYRSGLDSDYIATHLYYSREDIKAMEAGESGPGKFIAVMAFKDWVLQTYYRDYVAEIRTIYAPSKEYTNLREEKSLEIFGETPTDVSVLLLRKDSEEDRHYSQVYMVTHMLRERRLLLVAQYEAYTGMERVESFKAEAAARLKSMNFPEPGEDSLANAVTAVSAVALLLVAAGLGYGFYRFRPKRR